MKRRRQLGPVFRSIIWTHLKALDVCWWNLNTPCTEIIVLYLISKYVYFIYIKLYFYVKYQEEQTSLIPIESGVQQGSVLEPVLYLLYIAKFPTLRQTIVATFEDYTSVLASHSDPKIASNLHLDRRLPDLAETHLVKKITIESKTQTNVLDPRP
jgi:hypothetical protein